MLQPIDKARVRTLLKNYVLYLVIQDHVIQLLFSHDIYAQKQDIKSTVSGYNKRN